MKPTPTPPMSEEETALFEERAAIREYMGNTPRAEAERLAREDVRRMLEQKGATKEAE